MSNTDDPFRPDQTALRPRPGGGRRGPSRPPVSIAAGPEPEALPASAFAHIGVGLNPLVQAASPLLLLAAQLRDTTSPMDVAGLRRHALDEIHQFEERARAQGIPNGTVLAARYALCAGLDEAVLSTPWGSQSEWAQHPLLVALHREAWGGEKFFEMVDRMSQDPARHLDLLELQYLLIAFGFEGKYHVRDRGHEQLQRVQQELYERIRRQRPAPAERGLSLRWRGLEDRRNPLVRLLPWWVVAVAALPILAIIFTVYYTSLGTLAAPVKAELSRLDELPPPPPAPPAPGPTLKQLLAPEERAGALTVVERGAETTVTLKASDLFASGSATVNPSYTDTLGRITDALNRVPGAVSVIGHTDDQRIRSFRFSDNWELSRERARSVVQVLQQRIDNRGRLTFEGRGDSQPRYRPPSDPENRARNRRVEIVHVRGS